MSTIIKPAIFFIALGLMAGTANAQDKENRTTEKDKTIVIRPDKDSKEKYTIVVDGDKVTINGKPVDEFKSEGIDITRGGPGRYDKSELAPLFRGGWNMISPDAVPNANKALLGVVTEEAESGARVKEVSKGSAAEKAGLKNGDIIYKINDIKIENPEALYKAVSGFKPDDKISVSYNRDGKEYTTTAILTKNTSGPATRGRLFDNKNFDFRNFEPDLKNFRMETDRKPRLGMQIQDMENGKGVKVKEITEESAAFKAGIKEDDIITSINGNAVNSVADVKKELSSVKEKDEIKVSYLRNNKSQSTTIRFPKKLEEASL